MTGQTSGNLVYATLTDLITFTDFPNTQSSYPVVINTNPPLYVSPVTLLSGSNFAVSWIDVATNTHKALYRVGTSNGGGELGIQIPTDPSR